MTDSDAADAAFAAMVAANPNAIVLDGPNERTTAGDADAAFARMLAAYPNATVYGAPEEAATGTGARTLTVEEEYDKMVALHPGVEIIRGPAAGGYVPPAPAPGAASTWHFSPDLSPERLQEIMAMVGAQSGPTEAEAAAQQAAADEAFQQMVSAQPGAREIADGVYGFDQDE
jgi:hypothetical protein